MIRKIRTVLACLFFVAITLLFLDFTGTLHCYLGWLAKIQFLPAVLALNVGVVLALVVLTLLLGRVYCSVICPMGVMQDCFGWLGGKARKNRFHFAKNHWVLRAVVLVVFVLLMVLGLNGIAILIAPYSAYGRIATNLFQPVYMWLNNLCAYFAERADSYAFYSVDVWVKSGLLLAIAAVTFVVVGFLSFRWGRLWCNTICPVGTVLGFLSQFSLFQPRIDQGKCIGCKKCEKNCKSMCIDIDHHQVDYSRCVVCGDCLDKCKFDALHYTAKKPVTDPKPVDTERRAFLVGAAVAGTSAALAQTQMKVDGGLAVIEDKVAPERKTKITPPGSISAKHLAKYCTACQLCISQCPNNVLRPSTDLQNFMQPTMSFERGYCRPECVKCSHVCPAGAIKHLSREEKTTVHVGHAVWIKENCVVLTDGVSCGNCARHCPTGAIQMVDYEGPNGTVQVPAVDENKCIGCGACEHLCPARPFSAIYVEGNEMHHMN